MNGRGGRVPPSSRRTGRRRGVAGAALLSPRVPAAALYAMAMAAVAILAAWPIYADPLFGWLGVAAVAVALAISAAATLWRWPGWATLCAGVVAFFGIGLTLAVPPDAVRSVGTALAGVVSGAVVGWKDLITVDLPVGDYRNLMIPALVVLLAGALGTLRLGWRDDHRAPLAVIPALAMPAFGLLFGSSAVSAPLSVGGTVVAAPRELACGILSLLLSLLWMSWRAAHRRHVALRRAPGSTGTADTPTAGIRVTRRRTASTARRTALAAGMLAVAVGAAAIATPAVAGVRTRDVLRTGVAPQQAISRAVTPLTDYRANFTDAAFGQPLFTVTAVHGALPDRIRLATLSYYDGVAYRVEAPGTAAPFLRVPQALPAQPGTQASVRVTVQGLRGIWLPTFGAVRSLTFTGRDAAAGAASFYYDADARAGVQTAGVTAGETYDVTASTQPAPDLASLHPSAASANVPLPQSLKTWIDDQHAGEGGAALATLVQRLRQRGYLSHALTVPSGGAAWMRPLGPSYAFQPSASGHSLSRVDAMFTRLLQRQAAGRSLVGAVGDDEQFSVATALIAEHLGFPARVVVGARLGDGRPGEPACGGGVCTRGDLIAWTEVRASDGQWVPVDVTPQHTNGTDQTVVRQRDPQNPTEVLPQTAQVVQPPDAAQHDSDTQAHEPPDAALTETLWAALRIAGVVALGLVILCGPFAAVLVAKRLRRRGRRQADTASARVVGGWEEYVDAAVDHGRPAPGHDTRTETAVRYATEHGAALAAEADRAVFADGSLTDGDARRFWELVDAERRQFGASLPWWRRILAAVSLGSFARDVFAGRASGRTRRSSNREERASLAR